MHSANDDFLIEIFLADLKSEDKFIRELAITQLYHHIGAHRVREVLSEAADGESDPFLKNMIGSLLAMTSAPDLPEDKPTASSIDKNALLLRWRNHELGIKEMLQSISLLPSEQHISTIMELISDESELSRLLPMFSPPGELVRKPEIIATLAEKLYASDYIFVIRLISFLSEHSRNHLVKALPALLKHQNFMVRAEAIRFLFKISKQHALRLLEELIFADEASRRSASTFLLLFPFEDVQHIVLSLIDSGALQDVFLSKLLTHLVANNPDADFFKRLTISEVLRKDEIPEIEQLRREAAEALQLAGIIDRNIEEFCRSTRERVAAYIKERAGVNIVLEQDAAEKEKVAAPLPQKKAAKPQPEKQQSLPIEKESPAPAAIATEPTKGSEKPDSAAEKADSASENAETITEKVETKPAEPILENADTRKLREILAQESLSQNDRVVLRKLLMSGGTVDTNDLVLQILARFKPSDSQAIKWLEDSLEKLPPKGSLLAIKLLAELNPARIIPHLPVLCVNENEMIATQAIRLFRKHNLKGLLKQINSWLQEDRERSWKSALTALLQLKIDVAREILIKTFQTTSRTSLIKFFAPVFIISPDHMTLYELELLAAESRGSKHELISEITCELKEVLGVTVTKGNEESGTANIIGAGIHVKWEEFKQSLEKIRYISKNQQFIDTLTGFAEKHVLKALLLTFALFAYTFWPDSSISVPDTSTSEIEQTFSVNQKIPELKVGENRIFKLESYDPINRSWKATGLDGQFYRLKLPVPGDFSAGFKGDFKILYFTVTKLGYPVVTCELVAKLK
ncbi:MAG: hypothetical protein CVV42_07510 [Candidatus Riflebacteria bacterium HGW-Riflebacteria-2]|jgi:hypothetical protein|nr:MAG: hypothetical protein CVV42_07510 [Candidatus Riflebacteria bacterium HGW-Riflebacteria-2]